MRETGWLFSNSFFSPCTLLVGDRGGLTGLGALTARDLGELAAGGLGALTAGGLGALTAGFGELAATSLGELAAGGLGALTAGFGELAASLGELATGLGALTRGLGELAAGGLGTDSGMRGVGALGGLEATAGGRREVAVRTGDAMLPASFCLCSSSFFWIRRICTSFSFCRALRPVFGFSPYSSHYTQMHTFSS